MIPQGRRAGKLKELRAIPYVWSSHQLQGNIMWGWWGRLTKAETRSLSLTDLGKRLRFYSYCEEKEPSENFEPQRWLWPNMLRRFRYPGNVQIRFHQHNLCMCSIIPVESTAFLYKQRMTAEPSLRSNLLWFYSSQERLWNIYPRNIMEYLFPKNF